MVATKDLATLTGHVTPFLHLAESIIFDTDSVGSTTSVKEVLLDIQAGLGASGFPSVARHDCNVSLTLGQFVYVDATGTFQAGLADDISTARLVGVVSGIDSSFGTPCDVKATGTVTAYTGLVPGQEYFLSETVAGCIQGTAATTSGHVMRSVGRALSSDTLFIDLSKPPVIRS